MNNTQTQEELTWKRTPKGEYVARHGFWVYTVYRDDTMATGHQWVLAAYPEGNPDADQARRGFHNAKIAKMAALRTNCFVCGRMVPFATLMPHHNDPHRNWIIQTWRCRDTESCEAERGRLTARNNAQEYADALAEIAAAKARVRKLETAAYELRTRALATGTTTDEIDQIEQAHTGLPSRSVEEIRKPITRHLGMKAHDGWARHSHEVRPDHAGVQAEWPPGSGE